jgi:chorismate synthase
MRWQRIGRPRRAAQCLRHQHGGGCRVVPEPRDEPPFRVAAALFGIPGIRGVEFGAGFAAARMRGSAHNDAYLPASEGTIRTETNRHGGVLGGITTGMPLIVRAAVKPTPSVGMSQKTIHFLDEKEIDLEIKGRHDPCIVLRALPVAEAAAVLAVTDFLLETHNFRID